MFCIDSHILDELTEKAKASPRLRMNRNFHPSNESKCHRLLNAIEPDSYIPPHRHLDPEKDETFVLLRGKLGVISFNDNGEITGIALLVAGTDDSVVTLPSSGYHTAVSLASGTIFFETKAGPYSPYSEAEKAGWAPEEGSCYVTPYLHRLCALFNS